MGAEEKKIQLHSSGLVDQDVFEQILEMDDDPADRDFSKSIVYDFFEQADQTFDQMDKALTERNLRELKDLGHFLKGSSATLGLTHVKDYCEKIQNYGDRKDETGTIDQPDDDLSLERLKAAISAAKKEFRRVEKVLREFYED